MPAFFAHGYLSQLDQYALLFSFRHLGEKVLWCQSACQLEFGVATFATSLLNGPTFRGGDSDLFYEAFVSFAL